MPLYQLQTFVASNDGIVIKVNLFSLRLFGDNISAEEFICGRIKLGDEECRVLGCGAVYILFEPMFRRNVSPLS
jgi:hypothetical protein